MRELWDWLLGVAEGVESQMGPGWTWTAGESIWGGVRWDGLLGSQGGQMDGWMAHGVGWGRGWGWD